MTGHIPQSFIENLLTRVDIADVIGSRITLRRAGNNLIACCPFHVEKSPSFTVSPIKQFYHCFGCGANGDAIRFLTEYDGLHFVEAIEVLASRLGITVPTEAAEGVSNKSILKTRDIYEILEKAATFYQQQLKNHPMSDKAKNYLKSRGLTGQIAKNFGLGYAPSSWDSLLNALGTDPHAIENLHKAGLLIQKDQGRAYDRFRDRIMFPIRDRRGRVVGFGGRIIDQGEPKYLNSPETLVFNKGNELYGLFEARTGNRALKSLLVVEGYIDVVGLSQFGIKNAVATLGTALTERHIESLFKCVTEITFCFDGDKAGKEAAKRGLQLILPNMKEGRRVKFILLPNGEDPDSFIRKQGKDGFIERLQRAKPLSDFLFETFSEELDLRLIEGRSQLAAIAKPLINLIPNGDFQQLMLDRLSELTGINMQKNNQKPFFKKNESFQTSLKKSRALPITPSLRAIAFLLEHRTLLTLIGLNDDLSEVDIPGTALLCVIIEILRKDPDISLERVLNSLSEEHAREFEGIEFKAIVESVPPGGIEQEFLGALQRIRDRAQEQTLEKLLFKSKKDVLSQDEKAKLKELLENKEKKRVE